MTRLEARLRLSLAIIEIQRLRDSLSQPEARMVEYALSVLSLLRLTAPANDSDGDAPPSSERVA